MTTVGRNAAHAVLSNDLHEGQNGMLAMKDDARLAAVRRPTAQPLVRRGVVRYMFLAVDMSKNMEDLDYRPSRAFVVREVLSGFIGEFFDQNPLSQLGIIATHDKKATRQTDLSGNPRLHISHLRDCMAAEVSGAASLQHVLEDALRPLSSIPAYGSREVLIVLGSMASCDPGDIFATIERCKTQKIRVNIVGLSAELFICSHIAKETGGIYTIAKDYDTLKTLVFSHAQPPPEHGGVKDARAPKMMIWMGFPHRRDLSAQPSLCHCCNTLQVAGFICPRCSAQICELPSNCPLCHDRLASSPHLARSYHHLFPVPLFEALGILQSAPAPAAEGAGGGGSADAPASVPRCSGCMIGLDDSPAFKCPDCKQLYCSDCDLFIHESLHVCGTCASSVMDVQQATWAGDGVVSAAGSTGPGGAAGGAAGGAGAAAGAGSAGGAGGGGSAMDLT